MHEKYRSRIVTTAFCLALNTKGVEEKIGKFTRCILGKEFNMSPSLLFDRQVMKASSLDDITVRSDQGIVEVVFKMPLCRPLGFG